MTDLRIERVDGAAGTRQLTDWQHVHNTIIPTHHLTLDDVRRRAGSHHLELAYLDDILVGNSTVRPPEGNTVTVIVRVLAEYRGRGFGEQLYVRALARARERGAEVIETVVLETNTDGLRFALKRGFVEVERYVLDGETIPWIDLRLT
ncbi:GNAT family N-acetyltransferase [Streptomyces sp. NPDC002845]